jgi:hypothetical protein
MINITACIIRVSGVGETDPIVDCKGSVAEELNFLRLIKNAQMQGAPAFADLPTPAEAEASRRQERLRAGRRNPESGVATSKERLLATPASW